MIFNNDKYIDSDDPNSCINNDPIRVYKTIFHILTPLILFILVLVVGIYNRENPDIKATNICYNTSIVFLYIIGVLSIINYFNILFRTKIKENNNIII